MGIKPASEAPWTLFCPRKGCRPVPGRPMLPVIRQREIRQRELSVPVVCWEIPIPQKIMAWSTRPYMRAAFRMSSGSRPQIAAAFSGVHSFTLARSASNPSVLSRTNSFPHHPFFHDDVHHAVQKGHVGSGPELEIEVRVVGNAGPPRVGHKQTGTLGTRLFEEGRGNGMVFSGVGADDKNRFGLQGVGKNIGDRARADGLEQRR